jgi:hypothetical protein
MHALTLQAGRCNDETEFLGLSAAAVPLSRLTDGDEDRTGRPTEPAGVEGYSA